MDLSSSQSTEPDKETRDLQCLLDVFASNCSLEDIASAYSRANGDVNTAREILSVLQRGKSSSRAELRNGVVDCSQSGDSLEYDKLCPLLTSARGFKPKKFSVSTGIVSSVARNGTSHPCSHPNGVAKADKPLKMELKQPELQVDTTVPNNMPLSNGDVEEFLFSMLQKGFNLDMDKIQEVLRSCGYDGKKGMEELLALSSLNMVKDKKTTGSEIKMFADKCSGVKPHLPEKKYSTIADSHRELPKSSQPEDQKAKVSKEILEALFADCKRHEEPPKRVRLKLGLNRTRAFGTTVVSSPLIDVDSRLATDIPKQQFSKEDKEDDFDVLRRAAKQHWDSMKAYYEAAFDAFAKGEENGKVDYLLEQGHYHNEMAREADEMSAQVITGTRIKEDDVFTLDLHMHHSKEARSLLKDHLRLWAGTVRYLRVIIDSIAEDVTRGRRKLTVISFLKREQIQWSEEEGKPGTFLIQMDLIDPEKFSGRVN